MQQDNVRQEREKKKEYLNSYRREKSNAERLFMEMEEIRFNRMPAKERSAMPKAKKETDISNYMELVEDCEKRILQSRCRKIETFVSIRDRIEQLEDGREKDVLIYRYIKGQKWEDIADKMGYENVRQIHRIHNKALEHFKI